MKAFIIHANPNSPDGYFFAYCIPNVHAIERTASFVVLRGAEDRDVMLPDGKTGSAKETIATIALGPGVTVMIGERPPLGVRVPGEAEEERAIGFEPPLEMGS